MSIRQGAVSRHWGGVQLERTWYLKLDLREYGRRNSEVQVKHSNSQGSCSKVLHSIGLCVITYSDLYAFSGLVTLWNVFPVGIICRTEVGAKLTFEIHEETQEWALTPAQGNLEGRQRLMNCFDEGVSRVLLQNWGDKRYMMVYCGVDLCLWKTEPAWNYLESFLVMLPDKETWADSSWI